MLPQVEEAPQPKGLEDVDSLPVVPSYEEAQPILTELIDLWREMQG